MKIPRIPITRVKIPMMEKITVQLDGLSKSRNIKPPKTTRTDTKGIIAFIPSAAPLFLELVESVSQALKAASFAVEPKKVITQSSIIAKVTPTEAAETAIGKALLISSCFKNTKLKIEIPHRI